MLLHVKQSCNSEVSWPCSHGVTQGVVHSRRLDCVVVLQDYKTLYATMKRIADAEPRELDTWNITVSAGQMGCSSALYGLVCPSLCLACL